MGDERGDARLAVLFNERCEKLASERKYSSLNILTSMSSKCSLLSSNFACSQYRPSVQSLASSLSTRAVPAEPVKEVMNSRRLCVGEEYSERCGSEEGTM